MLTRPTADDRAENSAIGCKVSPGVRRRPARIIAASQTPQREIAGRTRVADCARATPSIGDYRKYQMGLVLRVVMHAVFGNYPGRFVKVVTARVQVSVIGGKIARRDVQPDPVTGRELNGPRKGPDRARFGRPRRILF
jgi:hypothetical protein